jgi:hypothetical protein
MSTYGFIGCPRCLALLWHKPDCPVYVEAGPIQPDGARHTEWRINGKTLVIRPPCGVFEFSDDDPIHDAYTAHGDSIGLKHPDTLAFDAAEAKQIEAENDANAVARAVRAVNRR